MSGPTFTATCTCDECGATVWEGPWTVIGVEIDAPAVMADHECDEG